MKECPKCSQPLRYRGVVMVAGVGLVVGAECPDEACKGHKVFNAEEWKKSLQWHPETTMLEKMTCQVSEGE